MEIYRTACLVCKKQFYALEKRWQNFAYVSFNDCVNDTLFQWIKQFWN